MGEVPGGKRAPGARFGANKELGHELLSLFLTMAPHSCPPTTLRPLAGLFTLPLAQGSLAVPLLRGAQVCFPTPVFLWPPSLLRTFLVSHKSSHSLVKMLNMQE